MTIPDDLWHHIPGWAAALILILGAAAWILSKLSQAYEPVAKAIPIMGRIWAQRGVRSRDAARLDAELEDLRRVVTFQGKQLEELRNRDEMYWSWILVDQEWHRREEFKAVSEGRTLAPHISFMVFRDRWLAEHPNQEEAS